MEKIEVLEKAGKYLLSGEQDMEATRRAYTDKQKMQQFKRMVL